MLPNISHPGFENVAHLSLANNKLTFIDQLPSKLIYLDLSQNNISVLNEDIRNFLIKRIHSSQLKLFLEGNPWSCSCEHKEFLKFVRGNAENIIDSAAMICGETGHSLIGVEVSDICPSALIYYATLTAFLMILILGINLLVIFRQPILIWFYEHEICLSLAVRRELDLEKKFDAFLSFTHKDEELVAEFVERLENGSHKFRLCFYLRDWLVGESIPECINRSVKDSRRIIILMTNNFLKSNWGRLEFRLALHATAKDRCKRLIVVLYPDVENFDDLDSELRAYMVLNTYLARDSPNFWNKLIYSMPHEKLTRQTQPQH
ncbi:protein toll-like [Drosophila bipectinata]|uniref:protein toll-like n=1 Tax=Drosophila bipectinata TaxID=42026 RepID=UPI0038B293CC